jgi:glycine/D-amino acid oxidase-like deaminating enzyme
MTEPETWYAATAVAAPERPALSHDLDVDVCVVGAGLAGLTIAREVARRGWSVAVLDAGEVAGGASGRNAGFVSPGFAERIDAIVERVGLPRAKELWALSEAGVEYVRSAIAETAMPGVEPRDGKLSVRRTDDETGLIEHAAMLRVDFGAEVEAWPTEQVREVLRSPYYFQGLHFPKAFHIHPLNYAHGLAADAEKHGARIFPNTQATVVDPAGVRKRVETPNGLIRARHVVLAGSVGVGSLDAQVGATVLPVSTYMAVTAPLGEKLFEAVRYTGAVADTRRAGDYYRIVADDRLLWGGRISTRGATPGRLKAQMRRDILTVYPQLGEIEIDSVWSGTMAYAVHKMPQLGELAPGYWLASAFGGHGLNTTAMAGEMIARAIVEGDDRWRLFSSYELVWAGGAFGRAVAQASLWSTQARDTLAGKIARYRERARKEGEARLARWDTEKVADATPPAAESEKATS